MCYFLILYCLITTQRTQHSGNYYILFFIALNSNVFSTRIYDIDPVLKTYYQNNQFSTSGGLFTDCKSFPELKLILMIEGLSAVVNILVSYMKPCLILYENQITLTYKLRY